MGWRGGGASRVCSLRVGFVPSHLRPSVLISLYVLAFTSPKSKKIEQSPPTKGTEGILQGRVFEAALCFYRSQSSPLKP